MPLITSPTLTQKMSKRLCYYFNSTYKIQFVRLWNGKTYLKKIIFPQQRILFEAKLEELLEVHTKQEDKQLIESIFVCHNLVNQPKTQLAAI